MAQPQPNVSDASLLAALQSGDESAWPLFFDRYDGLIRRVVGWHKWRFDSHMQDDLAQTVRAEIVKSIGTVTGPEKVGAFVKSACVHRCIDEVRRQVKARQVMAPIPAQAADGARIEETVPAGASFDPVREVVLREEAAGLRRAMDQLGDNCAKAVRQFYCEGLSYREMAEQNGIAVNTVGSRLAKCLERLRAMMTGGS
jgi:RNA polymerase sigma factor (sigma-70 family)